MSASPCPYPGNHFVVEGLALFQALLSLLLVMLAVSAGAVLGTGREDACHGRNLSPRLVDAVLIVFCWAGRFITSWQGLSDWLSFAIWIAFGIWTAYAIHRVRRQRQGQESREQGAHYSSYSPRLASREASHPISRLREWTIAVGGFQTRLILAALYYVLLMPFGLTVGLWSDPLRLHTKPNGTSWVPRPCDDSNLNESRRQF